MMATSRQVSKSLCNVYVFEPASGMPTLLPFFCFSPEISCATNQVAAKNRLVIGARVLQSRGELDGVASP
jgi:hypothetical protein